MHYHYTSFTKTVTKNQKKVVTDLPSPRHELRSRPMESSTLPMWHSTDNIGRPVLVLFQRKVLHNSRDRSSKNV